MKTPQHATTTSPADTRPPDEPLPPGDHPLEVAARRGIGPLSMRAKEIWHGHARPCVSCGWLVLREQRECDHCGQDLGDQMLKKMQAHAGPWYVFEHLHPFPGVSLERIIRQIHRRRLTGTSIVRGPATDFQWRFAIETPGLCRYFGRCWKCQHEVRGADTYCSKCLSYLSFDAPSATTDAPLGPPDVSESSGSAPAAPQQLRELSAALDGTQVPVREELWDDPPRVGPIRATWVAIAILVFVVAVLLWVTQTRTKTDTPAKEPARALLAPSDAASPSSPSSTPLDRP